VLAFANSSAQAAGPPQTLSIVTGLMLVVRWGGRPLLFTAARRRPYET
jgi:hypothetical protein